MKVQMIGMTAVCCFALHKQKTRVLYHVIRVARFSQLCIGYWGVHAYECLVSNTTTLLPSKWFTNYFLLFELDARPLVIVFNGHKGFNSAYLITEDAIFVKFLHMHVTTVVFKRDSGYITLQNAAAPNYKRNTLVSPVIIKMQK